MIVVLIAGEDEDEDHASNSQVSRCCICTFELFDHFRYFFRIKDVFGIRGDSTRISGGAFKKKRGSRGFAP